MKKVFLFIAAALMSAMTWAETATSTFTDKNWTVGEGEEEWVAAGAATTSFDTQNGRGVQITLKNIQNDGLTLTNSTIQDLGDISKVEVVYSSNCEGSEDGTIAVAVGATAFGEAFTIKKENNATISFENETAVAGDIVITFTSTATSKSVYVKSITVTYGSAPTPATLDSIVIRGKATKMEYKVDEAFDPAGLEVWGIYTKTVKHDSTSQIKSGIAWSIDPETFEEVSDNASVTLSVSYKDLTTTDTTITGIKVTEKPAKITTIAGITSGKKYYIGATTGTPSSDFYFFVDGSAASETSVKGTAVTDVADAVALTFTAVTGGWTLQFENGNYLGLKNASDNGKVLVSEDLVVWTIEEDATKGLLKLTPNGTYYLQKNNSGTQFGSYKNSQTNVWLTPASVGPVTGIREAMVNANVRKAMVNGRLIIVKGEKAFDLQGRIVK